MAEIFKKLYYKVLTHLNFFQKKKTLIYYNQQIHGLGMCAVCSQHENTAAMELAHEYGI